MLQKKKYNSSETQMSQYLFNNYWNSKKSTIHKYNQPADNGRILILKNVAIMSIRNMSIMFYKKIFLNDLSFEATVAIEWVEAFYFLDSDGRYLRSNWTL